MPTSSRPRPWFLAAGATVALTAALPAAPAQAATVTTQNACEYSYDQYWRNLDMTLQGVVNVADARAGDTINATSQAFDVALPDWLAEYGYRFGILQPGDNEIDVSVWVAIRGTNTVEGVQWQRIDGTADTTITALEDGTFVSATPITYAVTPLSATSWTAKGGDVTLKQAPAGSLPQLPVGPNDSMRTPQGSIFIQARFGSSIRLNFDCLPGEFAGAGAGYVEGPAQPYATTRVPTYECLSAVPAATNRAGVEVGVLPAASIAPATSGQPYDLGSRLRYRLPQAYLQQLASAGVLQEGANAVAGSFTVAVDGSPTEPGRRLATVALPAGTVVNVPAGGGAITVDASDATDALAATLVLPSTSWSFTGTSPLRFAAGAAGAVGELASVAGVTGAVTPYGGVYGRLSFTAPGDDAQHLSLDCVSGRTSVADAGVAYAESGNRAGGDQGRFGVQAYAPDPFSTVPVAVPTPEPTPEPTPAPTATPDPGPGPGTPPPAPAPAVPSPTPVSTPVVTPGPVPQQKKTTLRFLSTKLRSAKGKVPVSLQCAGTIGICRGTVTLRTQAKVKVGKKRKLVTLTRSRTYTVNPGFTKLYKLSLGKDGAALVRRAKTTRVTVIARPRGTKTALTKKLTLTRG